MTLRTKKAKELMAEIDEAGRDNIFTVSRVYGMAFVYYFDLHAITVHEYNYFMDIRDEALINFRCKMGKF